MAALAAPRLRRELDEADGDTGEEGGRCPPGGRTAPAARRWVEILSAAYRRATALGKPLLVLVVPADLGGRYERGAILGELLNHAGDDVMAALALAEVTCAPMTAVRALFPSAAAGEPLAIVLETDGLPARMQAIPAGVVGSPVTERIGRGERDWAAQQAAEEAAVDARIAAVGKALAGALAPDALAIQRRARQQEARLSSANVLRVRVQAVAGANLPAAEVDAAAALIHEAALRAPAAHRQRLVEALAGAARARLTGRRVPGSRWANASGCGSSIERLPDEPEEMTGIACGMGHVPRKSRRFLDFLTPDGSWDKEGF